MILCALLLLAAEGLAPARLAEMDAAVRSGEFRKIGSVLVSRQGKLVHEAYYEGDAATLRNTRSASKSVTSMLIGIAIDRGLIKGAGARAFEFLGAFRPFANPDPRKEAITVADLLSMSSALDCDDNEDSSPGNEEKMYPLEDWVRFGVDLPLRAQTGFSYCTAGSVLLGAVLQSAAHMPVEEFARKELFAPLGISGEQWSHSPKGQAMTGGGLELRSGDLLKLAELWRNRGAWKGRRVVDAQWIEASTAPHARVDENTGYGYLFWLKSFPAQGTMHPAYFMAGNGGNKVMIFPDLDLSVVITSTNYSTRGMHQQTERLLTEYVLASLYSQARRK